jgi:polysaccharide pyruvyl transferase WcaK-like protein
MLVELFEAGGNIINSIGALEFHQEMNSNFQSLSKRALKRFFPTINYGARIPDSLDQYQDAVINWFENPNRIESRLLKNISECNVVIYNAEGSTHSNNLSAKKGLFLLYLAARMRKTTLFINGSVTLQKDCTDKIAPVLAHVAKYIDMIYLRESLSHRTVCDIVGKTNCNFLPDSIFKLYEITDSEVRKIDNDKYFLVSSSMSKPFGAYAPDKIPIGKIVDSLALQFGRPIFLIKDPEDAYLAKFAKSRGYSIYSENNVNQIFSLFNNASFLLSGRFHHLILATINGCPIIALDTTSAKNRGIVEMLPQLGYSNRILNPSNILASSEFIHEQADIICKSNTRLEAKDALMKFTRSQYKLLLNGFG